MRPKLGVASLPPLDATALEAALSMRRPTCFHQEHAGAPQQEARLRLPKGPLSLLVPISVVPLPKTLGIDGKRVQHLLMNGGLQPRACMLNIISWGDIAIFADKSRNTSPTRIFPQPNATEPAYKQDIA
jgi:hypothetical protein